MIQLIDMLDIKETINDLLKDTGIKTVDNGYKEGFKRPCFFVQILPIGGTDLLKGSILENSYMIEINYFSKSQKQIDNLKMAEILKKKVFPYINIKDRKLVPRNVRNEDIDGVLSFRFNLSWLDALPRKENTTKATKLKLEME
ncbi:hypothetical protein phiCTC2B_41 (endogenous virus) [Clostridium phage phiCTC2B]|uniref:phage tail terminator family protein n=1 Tax=Clostridium tetani TaxID=1513 RepID=UPI000572AB27|nr:hypothetical protein [Clostridium tetani]YP_009276938.1 hypothetical protein phiCT19406B_41 [Clostridium phage phiCT19406B]YP_009277382.1 hypothetical protein phiCTC2B_41 [Clostridium phage phiCTC2B]AJA42798.1 hypothetical protein phiCT19406B_41 [Clostridium phage phiCT19406B]AJA42994.1 hypothetical protein phiCTC2B_41 [Clostridium phage phiCTC2B]SJZ75343.1 hypothetical protein SAMN02745112_01169 [Clostridium tetani]BDR84878.1 hypothetical protein K254310026_22890 [Clostridium tetani]